MRKRKSRRTGKDSAAPRSRLIDENRQLAAKSGLPPGSLVYVGKKVAEGVSISMVRHDQSRVEVTESARVQELPQLSDDTATTWITVEGLHEIETIGAICWRFQLHPLVTEDILNTTSVLGNLGTKGWCGF